MQFKKLMAFAVATILIVTVLMPICSVSAAHKEPYTAEEIDLLLLDKSNTYQKYLEQIGDKPLATETLNISVQDFYATSDDADIQTLASFEGKENVIKWETSTGSVSYEVNVPADGFYNVKFTYYPLKGSGNKINLGFQVDDGFPFSDLTSFSLNRIYNSEDGIKQDTAGNDYNTHQIEIFEWTENYITSDSGVTDQPFLIYLTKGKHSIVLYSFNQPFVLANISICPPKSYQSYDEYVKEHGKVEDGVWGQKFEAENTFKKSEQSVVASTDRSSSKNSPYDITKNKLNVIGGDAWSFSGQWLEWEVEVPKTGYYEMFFRFKQSYKSGMLSHRRLSIDGEVPFEEADVIGFEFSHDWQGKSLTNDDGEVLYLYLTEGKHTVRLENVIGGLAEPIASLNSVVANLNNIYRKCLMITGPTPDTYRDYNLHSEIPELVPTLEESVVQLKKEYANIKEIFGQDRDVSDIINVLIFNLEDMIAAPSSIPQRLSTLSGNVGSLSSWILELKEQPLLLDYIYLCEPNAEKPTIDDGFFGGIWREIRAFFYSFITDYSNFGNKNNSYDDVITVWVNSGRDQANVINAMINDLFTPNYNIGVNLKITNATVIQAYLSGRAPDVSLMVGRGQPVNLAIRGALTDISKLDGFDEVKDRFQSTAFVPYTFDGGVYAVPDTQTFYMMFYRKDIFNELNLTVPNTWNDFWKVTKVIQANNMGVGLPYTSVDAAGAVDSGMGTRNVFPALLLQGGGRFYNDNLSATELNTKEALDAFQLWTDIYSKKGLDLTFDFYNRFRSGDMPLGFASYTEYNRLVATAPEISGLWEMVPIPGTKREDGTINRAQGGAGTASVLLRAAEDRGNLEPAWEFLKWWCSAEAQTRYALDIESVLGVTGRVAVANCEAFANLSWNGKEYNNLIAQRNEIQEIPEAPGGYYLTRDLDNAFRDVLYNGRNARESLLSWKLSIDSEISRKREEFGLE